VTSDVSLQDVNLRLAADLPPLELEHMSGRISVRLAGSGVVINGKQVELAHPRLPIRRASADPHRAHRFSRRLAAIRPRLQVVRECQRQ
jgi:hypothetical protein